MRTIHGVVLAVLFTCAGCAGTAKNRNGLEQGTLAPCPDTPNCVSSLADSGPAAIAPLRYEGINREAALDRLTGILQTEPRCRIVGVTETDGGAIYVHAEFRSSFFRFVDDVEFLLPGDEPLIHVRSASRLGYSDMGVNRQRVERLRERFADTAAPTQP